MWGGIRVLNSSRIANLIYEHRENKTFKNSDSITFDEAYELCKKYINKHSKKSMALKEGIDAKEESIRLIESFVNTLKTGVIGYEDEKGLVRLKKDLKDEIVDYKAITELMSDEGIGREVTEIRINSHKSIIYERKGKTYVWPKTFKNPEELEKVLAKLLGEDKRLSRATPFLNSSTIEGYRVNATDKSISRNNDDYTAVIRKFNPAGAKLQLVDIVGFRTLSDNMANLLTILPKARFSFLTVGGTGSGKTVTNEIIISGIRPMDRQIYIENPCELTPGIEGGLIKVNNVEGMEEYISKLLANSDILAVSPDIPLSSNRKLLSVRKEDAKKIIQQIKEKFGEDAFVEYDDSIGYLNDFIQMQSNSDKKDPGASDPTPNNLVENALRQTPTWIVVGEARSDEEFKVLLKAAQTGHKVITTFHADDPEDAIRRYLVAYLSAAQNVPLELVLQNICSAFKFIINVEKLHDGTRRIMYITEIVGAEGNKPILNDIYRYEIDYVDENGKIHGKHKRVGKLHESSIKQFRKMGIPDKHYEIYTTEPSADEEETYNGIP